MTLRTAHCAGRAHIRISPVPQRAARGANPTLQGNPLVLQVPVGARWEVQVQGMTILLPPDVGLRGPPGITAQRGWLLSQQGEVGGPRCDGRRDCGGDGSDEQRKVAHHCTGESSPAVGGLQEGSIQLSHLPRTWRSRPRRSEPAGLDAMQR